MRTIVFNTSPLIFLARLGLLKEFVQSPDHHLYLPEAVATEIQAKSDQAGLEITQLIDAHLLQVKGITLISLARHFNKHLGKGESEAMVLGIELQTDYLILDDAAARREALRLGLTVKGTLAIIKAMGQIDWQNKEEFYQQLLKVNFRVKRKIFDEIFQD